MKIDTGGNHVVWATPLDRRNGGGVIKLGSGTLSLAGGPVAAAGPVSIDSGSLKLEPATTGGVSVPNPGFETPAYASQGYLVCNVDYRLAPQYPFPAAIEDACAAWLWVRRTVKSQV